MGCELRDLPGEVIAPSGESLRIRFLFNPETGVFVNLINLNDDESISLEEIEYWERRLTMEIPKGDNTH